MARRIGCLLLPDFTVAVHRADEPGPSGDELVVIGPDEGSARVVAASAAAASAGVGPGMTLVQARARCARLRWVEHDAEVMAAAERAVLAEVEVHAVAVERVRPGLWLLELPPARGAAEEAARLRELLAAVRRVGHVDARVGAAANRFTAEAAARTAAEVVGASAARGDPDQAACGAPAAVASRAGDGPEPGVAGGGDPIVVVPTGAEARFLADKPIGLLPLTDEEYFRFRALGLRRLGDVAVVPEATLRARWGARGLYLARLSRGQDGATLRASDASLRERFHVAWREAPADDVRDVLRSVGARLRPLLRRLRSARGLACASLRATLHLIDRRERVFAARPDRPTTDAKALVESLRERIAASPPPAPVVAVTIELDELVAMPADARDLFEGEPARAGSARERAALDSLLDRLGAAVGHDRVLRDTPRVPKEASDPRVPKEASDPRVPKEASDHHAGESSPLPSPAVAGSPLAYRPLRAPRPADVALGERGAPATLDGEPVVACAGPGHASGPRWASGLSREYYDVLTRDASIYRIFRDRARGRWFVEGVYD